MTARSTQRGFTLIELMIALVLFSIATAGSLSIAVTLTNGYREQRQAIVTEQSVRAPMDFIADAIRSASPGSPSGIIPAVAASSITDAATCHTGVIEVTDSTNAPDDLTVAFASGGVVTSTRSIYGSGGSTTSITVTNPTGILPGDWLLISNLSQGTIVRVASTWTNPGGTSPTAVALVAPGSGCSAYPGAGYPALSYVIRVFRARFYIDSTAYGVPTLMMDPDAGGPVAAEPLAENIEDMQIALGVDANGDKTVDPTAEWAFSSGTGALVGQVRAVRITLTSRAPQALPGAGATAFHYRGAENRAASTANDGYRRRVLTTTVEVRSMAGSP